MGRTHIRTKNYHTHTERHKAPKSQIPTLENKYHVYSLMFFTLWNLIKKKFFFLEQSLKINKYNQCYTFKLNLRNCVEMKYYATWHIVHSVKIFQASLAESFTSISADHDSVGL